MEEVRSTTAWVATHSSHVTVDFSGPSAFFTPMHFRSVLN